MAEYLIIIPTYNERENIEELLESITRIDPALHLLVVDDNSPDRTYEVVESLMRSTYSGRLFLLKRAGKMGLGTAYIAGFRWALARDYK